MEKINLLNEFFNSKSDASVLEASEQERMEKDFQQWFEEKTKDFHFMSHLLLQTVNLNFDPYQTLIVTTTTCQIVRAEKGVETEEYVLD